MKVIKEKLHRARARIEDKDPDIYRIPDLDYLSSYSRMKKREPDKRLVLKIKRDVMRFINGSGIKL